MTALNVAQLLTFVAFLGLAAYAVFAPRDANAAKRRRQARLYSGWALIAGAAFMAAIAADRVGWSRYVFGAIALAVLVGAAVAFAKNREK
ncbi:MULTISPECIES: hypothetical protein [Mycolicibacterium]|jgi:uncharacterized membrane protein YhaH (DUF805 family)|uniref:Transmembrane protein n=2 Tax=Mycolicibacterium TaxID=1866885 RepID=A1T1R3_MYCVP|nr:MULTISPECIES: hypothetical protein [Mycolicibacterium]ABM11113.1 hypothetical protein Mvan_0264 [Mycolicibacterium vanbaalenii PYR-1]MCV7127987.1 hypothetical protein [Mycolicibacterium vanbaalenii PYR-1]MDN4516631.1 hypothetical protein [Mycolicibacterium austroafricanum]MDW5610241.1 hypothetical protein [Mycolicibacterium sp. D5.8-2]PQP51145.1 hypothetical protein C6A88_08645 [Mycolicibacterium austroafricanum]